LRNRNGGKAVSRRKEKASMLAVGGDYHRKGVNSLKCRKAKRCVWKLEDSKGKYHMFPTPGGGP
jgi:hypothetical protein